MSKIQNVVAAAERPTYQHDCTACLFLGTAVEEGKPYDLYIHKSSHGPSVTDTVIARFGNEPSEYSSGMDVSYGMSPLLTKARLRAQAAGVWTLNPFDAMWYAKGEESRAEVRIALRGTLEGRIIEAETSFQLALSVLLLEQVLRNMPTEDVESRILSVYQFLMQDTSIDGHRIVNRLFARHESTYAHAKQAPLEH